MSDKPHKQTRYYWALALALTILFVVLKLTGYITWSWLWVLSPLWISFCIILFIIGFAFVVWLAMVTYFKLTRG